MRPELDVRMWTSYRRGVVRELHVFRMRYFIPLLLPNERFCNWTTPNMLLNGLLDLWTSLCKFLQLFLLINRHARNTNGINLLGNQYIYYHFLSFWLPSLFIQVQTKHKPSVKGNAASLFPVNHLALTAEDRGNENNVMLGSTSKLWTSWDWKRLWYSMKLDVEPKYWYNLGWWSIRADQVWKVFFRVVDPTDSRVLSVPIFQYSVSY